MVEKTKDAEDRLLEAMFATEPLLDDGFSEQVIRTVRRRLWLRRTILPVAAILGGAVAFKPLTTLLSGLGELAAVIPVDVLGVVDVAIPQFPMVALGAALFAAVTLGAKISEV